MEAIKTRNIGTREIEIQALLSMEDVKDILMQRGLVFVLEGIKCDRDTGLATIHLRPGNGVTWIKEDEAHDAAS